jgi:hypothetical protein
MIRQILDCLVYDVPYKSEAIDRAKGRYYLPKNIKETIATIKDIANANRGSIKV